MGDEQKLSADEQIDLAREQFEEGTDFTLAVEEEFAVLDPATLSLVNRFEDIQAAAEGSELQGAPCRRADRLRGRGEDRPLRELRRGRAEARRASVAGARALRLARDRARGHGNAPVEPLAGAADHRHAALPAQRRDAPLRRLAQQHLRPARTRGNPGRRSRGRGAQRAPQLSPRPVGTVRVLALRRGLLHAPASARSQIFTKMFPRCGVPDAYADWADYERSCATSTGTDR